MSEPYSYNPFLGPPPPDPNDTAAMLRQPIAPSWTQPLGSQLSPPANPLHGQAPLLSLADQAALAKAPKLPGTTVTVRGYGVGVPWDPLQHMYAQFDDGTDSYIYRGGPKADGSVTAAVTPASQSPDYQAGGRVLYQAFLPRTTAAEAIQPAQADAARVNRTRNPYLGLTSNSNSVIGDFTAKQYGHRVGDARTPGSGYDLPDESPFGDPPPIMPSPYGF